MKHQRKTALLPLLVSTVLAIAAASTSGCASEQKLLRAPHYTLSHPDYWKVESVAKQDGEPTFVKIGRYSNTVMSEGVGADESTPYEASQADVEVRLFTWNEQGNAPPTHGGGEQAGRGFHPEADQTRAHRRRPKRVRGGVPAQVQGPGGRPGAAGSGHATRLPDHRSGQAKRPGAAGGGGPRPLRAGRRAVLPQPEEHAASVAAAAGRAEGGSIARPALPTPAADTAPPPSSPGPAPAAPAPP